MKEKVGGSLGGNVERRAFAVEELGSVSVAVAIAGYVYECVNCERYVTQMIWVRIAVRCLLYSDDIIAMQTPYEKEGILDEPSQE